ncbi:MAG: DUF6089 family protein [Niabella sp.]
MIQRLPFLKYFFTTVLLSALAVISHAQEYKPDKSRVGITAGALTYTGRYSVDNSLTKHSSWGVSLFYVPNISVVKNLDFKIELTGGQLKADNTQVETVAAQGSFNTNIIELAAKAEYNFINLDRHNFSPYIATGPGVYRLFNYSSTSGEMADKNMMGFTVPVGGGLKYKISPKLLLLLDGNIRFFCNNIDNVAADDSNNPNRYINLSLGVSYHLGKNNILW